MCIIPKATLIMRSSSGFSVGFNRIGFNLKGLFKNTYKAILKNSDTDELNKKHSSESKSISVGGENTQTYTQISMDEAKKIFESGTDAAYIILDVRRTDEFAEGHIPGAINIANESIGAEAPAELSDKNQLIYIYCRSGNRSKQAAEKLAALGYTNIIEFGGIIDWTGEIEKE
jgi:rhodanese-related sulfurtransferase